MPGFWKTIRKSLGDSYDCLGSILVCSFVWFTVAIGVLSGWAALGVKDPKAWIAFGVALYGLLLGPLTAGVYHVARKIVTRDDPSPLDLFRGAREHWGRAVLLAFSQITITVLIGVNAWFYLTRGSMAIKALGMLFLYAMLVWLMSALYHFPILIEQRPGTLRILKRGILLALDNPAFTVFVAFAIILLTCFSIGIMLPMALLYMGLSSVVLTRALRALFVKYELLPPEKEPTPDDDPWEAVADDPHAAARARRASRVQRGEPSPEGSDADVVGILD